MLPGPNAFKNHEDDGPSKERKQMTIWASPLLSDETISFFMGLLRPQILAMAKDSMGFY